jgi:hypothetical protein
MVCQILMVSVNATQDLVVSTVAKNNAHWDCQINLQKLKRNAAVTFMGNATLKLESVTVNRVSAALHVNLVAHLVLHLTVANLPIIKERTPRQRVHCGTRAGRLSD